MSARFKIWLFPVLLYGLFTVWYTDFSGPLSDAEVSDFMAAMQANQSEPEVIAFIEAFARADTGRQFIMLNAIDYNDNPGFVAGAAPGEDAEALMGRYMAHMIPALLIRASHPLFMGPAVYPAIDVVGIEGAENWNAGALMRYRSRRDFLEIVTNPIFKSQHHFKAAALEKTIAYPIEPDLQLGDPRVLLGLLLLALTALTDLIRLSRQSSQQ